MAFTKPTDIPRWADTTANILEPPAGQKDSGWILNQVARSDWENWTQNRTGLWIKWLNEFLFDSSSVSRIIQGVNADTALADTFGGTIHVSGGAATGDGGSQIIFDNVEAGQGPGLTVRAPTEVGRFNQFGTFVLQGAHPSSGTTIDLNPPLGASKDGIRVATLNNSQTGIDVNLGATDVGVDVANGLIGVDLLNNTTGVDITGGTTGVSIDATTTGVNIDTTTTGVNITGGTTGLDLNSVTTGIDIQAGNVGLTVNNPTAAGVIVTNAGLFGAIITHTGSQAALLITNNGGSGGAGIFLTNNSSNPGIDINSLSASSAIDVTHSGASSAIKSVHQSAGAAAEFDTVSGDRETLLLKRNLSSPAIKMDSALSVPNGTDGGLLTDPAAAFRYGDTRTLEYFSPRILLYQVPTFGTFSIPATNIDLVLITLPRTAKDSTYFAKGVFSVSYSFNRQPAVSSQILTEIHYGGTPLTLHTTFGNLDNETWQTELLIDQTSATDVTRSWVDRLYIDDTASVRTINIGPVPFVISAANNTFNLKIRSNPPGLLSIHNFMLWWSPLPR